MGGSAAQLSAAGYDEDDEFGIGDDHSLPQGYSQLPQYLAKDLSIRTSCVVTRIGEMWPLCWLVAGVQSARHRMAGSLHTSSGAATGAVLAIPVEHAVSSCTHLLPRVVCLAL